MPKPQAQPQSKDVSATGPWGTIGVSSGGASATGPWGSVVATPSESGHGKPGHGKPDHGKPGHGKPGHGKPHG